MDSATCGNLGTGICITNANLSDDLFLFHNRTSNRSAFLRTGLTMGFPTARTYTLVGGNAHNRTEARPDSSSK